MATTDARIQVRRDTAANWTSNNPTLSAGEIGFETDNGEFKIGDGTAAWTSLSYAAHNPDDYPSDTAWTTVTSLDNGWTGTVRYIKRAGWVTIEFSQLDASSRVSPNWVIDNIASGYKPTNTIYGVGLDDANSAQQYIAFIGPTGTFGFRNTSAITTDIRGSITYPVL